MQLNNDLKLRDALSVELGGSASVDVSTQSVRPDEQGRSIRKQGSWLQKAVTVHWISNTAGLRARLKASDTEILVSAVLVLGAHHMVEGWQHNSTVLLPGFLCLLLVPHAYPMVHE